MKKMLAIFLCLMMLFSSFVFAADFSDLPSTHWAYDNVMSLVNDGVINGYTDGTYKPQKQITRGEFFKLIMVASEGEETFKDSQSTGEHWAFPYANFAYENGLLMMGTYIDELNSPMTRLEMGVVLAKVALHKEISDYTSGSNAKLSDLGELNDSERTYIEHVIRLGLINGYTDGTFKPNNNMTRAEVAAVIYRFLDKLN